jgi:chromate transporter
VAASGTPPTPTTANADDADFRPPTLGEAFRVWARIGLLSFGGPAGQIALMHRELVERRRWLGEARFLHALNYCMLLPGPEAQQLAIYVGWLLHRTRGGLIAGVLFVLPGFVAILALSAIYAYFGAAPLVGAVFYGLKAAVLAVVVQALLRIGRRALRSRLMVGLALAAFVAIHFFAVPFPWIVLAAGLVGYVGQRLGADEFAVPPPAAPASADEDCLVDRLQARGRLQHARPSRRRALRVAATCLAAWLLPVLVVLATLGPHSVLAQQAQLFGTTAVVSFGGAYAVLAYVAQQAVETFAWLTPDEMLDGLALAETTPGPLILVVQFVAFLASFRSPDGLEPLVAALLGSALTVWVTFVPSFLWIFLGAPYMESLRGNARLHAALSAITAAVVGVIANLGLWFSVHTIFGATRHVQAGPARFEAPVWSSVDSWALALTLAALVAMLRYGVSLAWTLLGSAVVGAAIFLLAR